MGQAARPQRLRNDDADSDATPHAGGPLQRTWREAADGCASCWGSALAIPVPLAVVLRRRPRRRVLVVGVGGPRGCGSIDAAVRLSQLLGSPLYPIELDWFRDRARMPQGADGRRNADSPLCINFAAAAQELRGVVRYLARASALPASLTVSGCGDPGEAVEILRSGQELARLGSDSLIVVIEGAFVFLDDALARMVDCPLWLDCGRDLCKARRWEKEREGRFAGRSFQVFSEWFDALVWPEQEGHQSRQLANASRGALLRLCADADDQDSLVRAAATHASLLIRGLEPAPRGLATPPSSEEDSPSMTVL
eukprot:TRINITY_DN51962_c0_g1_i1.p1 TRINITY_DN51962_c0_g1~~TRINITY_DN51962_c0_g1_i1.p1  ORF type:complete len:310 (+),score=66.26 TRINITY_DN51962_c0_g1_i1:97-1026(+)